MAQRLPKSKTQRVAMAADPNTDLETLEILAKNANSWLRTHIACHPNASTALLAQIILDNDGALLEDDAVLLSRAAIHPNLAMEDLLRLAQYPHRYVRQCVTDNPNITPEILDSLSEDPDLILYLAKNSKTRPETLRRLAVRYNPPTRGHVPPLLARNPSTPYDMWHSLASFQGGKELLRQLP